MTRARRALRAVVALALLAGLSGCSVPRWQSELVSVRSGGGDSGDGPSWGPEVSADGTKIVFESRASNLGPTDTNGQGDVYIRDLTTGEISLVSVNATGTDSGNGTSRFPSLSSDGTKVLFLSYATDLASPATEGRDEDLYLRDLVAGTTTLVSVNAAGTGGADGNSSGASLSPAGDKVMFHSDARNLAVPDPGGRGIYERDLTTRVTTRLGNWSSAAYSPSGDAIAFIHEGKVWLRNTRPGAVVQASPDLPVDASNGTSSSPLVFSHDGTKLAFERDRRISTATTTDIYVFDRVAGVATLATPAASGSGAANDGPTHVYGFDPTNSSRLLFSSNASNLVTNDANGSIEDVFVRNLSSRATRLVSVTSAGTGSGFGISTEARWVGDGTKIAFLSWGHEFGVTDTNSTVDVYVRDDTARSYRLVSVNGAGDNSGNGDSGQYLLLSDIRFYLPELSVSADGSLVAFGSEASNLGPTDTPRTETHDVYVARLVTPAA